MSILGKTKELITSNYKRYLISSAVTFSVGFITVLLAQWEGVTLQNIQNGAILGIIFVALRAGLKALLEYALTILPKKESEK